MDEKANGLFRSALDGGIVGILGTKVLISSSENVFSTIEVGICLAALVVVFCVACLTNGCTHKKKVSDQ